jgi:hypothetical protein
MPADPTTESPRNSEWVQRVNGPGSGSGGDLSSGSGPDGAAVPRLVTEGEAIGVARAYADSIRLHAVSGQQQL